MNGKPWTPEDLEQLRQLYPDLPTKEVARRMGRSICSINGASGKYDMKKSEAYLASPAACRLRREASPASIATRFKPGIIPANKGLRRPGWAPGRMASTQFKPGQRNGIASRNWKPIGTILADNEGYLRIKVREGCKGEPYGFGNVKIWPLLQRHTWEQHHGCPVPEGHTIVFKDKDRNNTAIENLECISRKDLMIRNSSQRWGKEVFQAIQLRGALNRKLRSLSEKQDLGSSQPSV